MQQLSRYLFRDKAPNNALIAKAVEACERKQLPILSTRTGVRARSSISSVLTALSRGSSHATMWP